MASPQSCPRFLLWPPPQKARWSGATVRLPKVFSAGCVFPELRGEWAWLGATEEAEPPWLQSKYYWQRPWRNPPLREDTHSAWVRITQTNSLPQNGYRLKIAQNGISIEAVDLQGAKYGLGTLRSLFRQCQWQLPCGVVEDWPDFPIRGFMLDISRGKVPNYNGFIELLRIMAQLKYNHLQLYTEHTYAFKDHHTVWRHASPLIEDSLAYLEFWCDIRDIELAANFNSFGHFERWLKHPKYKHLAECPDGFEHPIKGQVPHGTTLKPNAASLKFLDKLWAEYLPLFKSKRFNLGGDEPWELGQGWSKSLVKKYGKHRVYLNFLKKLHRQAAQHGKEMLFWGDILLESPELVKEVPKDATALLWGYEADHPFEKQCAQLATAKRKFWVCPGTSAWNTFTGRTDNMLANIESAAKHGLANGAEGMLLTSWGDGGNHQPWPVMYPGLVFAAGMAWNQKGTKRADLASAINLIFNGQYKSGYGETLLELGRVENTVAKPRPNRSRHYDLLFATREQLAKELQTLSPAELKKISASLMRIKNKLNKNGWSKDLNSDWAGSATLGRDMAAWAVKRAQWTLAGKSTRPLVNELHLLMARFEKVWFQNARDFELDAAFQRLRAVEKEL